MYSYKTAILTPPQVAAMDRLPIAKQEQIKDRFGQPLVLSKAYYLLRDATQNFTLPATETIQRLDTALYELLQRKSFFSATKTATTEPVAGVSNPNILIVRPATVVPQKQEKKVSFADYPLSAKFMPRHQKDLVARYPDDDKRQILEGIEENLKKLRGYRSQDGMGDNAIVYAHYFYGQTDYFITETDFDEDAGYENLIGFAILNGDTQFAEFGAVSLDELVQSRRIELDFYWMPVTLGAAKANAYPDVWGKGEKEVSTKESDLDVPKIYDVKGNLIKIGSRVMITGLDKIKSKDTGGYYVSPYNERRGVVQNVQHEDIDVLLYGDSESIGFSPNNIQVMVGEDEATVDKWGNVISVGNYVVVENYPSYITVGQVTGIEGSLVQVFAYLTGKVETYRAERILVSSTPKFKKGDKANYKGITVEILSDAKVQDIAKQTVYYKYLAIAPEWTDAEDLSEYFLTPITSEFSRQPTSKEDGSLVFPAKLSELLRFLKPGMRLIIVDHSLAPNMVSQLRIVKQIRSKDIILTRPDGVDTYLEIPKASQYKANGDTFTFSLENDSVRITYKLAGENESMPAEMPADIALPEPKPAISDKTVGVPIEQKIKRAKTTLALLKKALPRLEGSRLKTAKTEMQLLKKFLQKNK